MTDINPNNNLTITTSETNNIEVEFGSSIDDNIEAIITEPDCINIEISGLTSINSFIGLDDTPTYYDNGKFFKVIDNKIVYTDITWEDIKGDISANPDLEQQIKDIASQYSEAFVVDTVNTALDKHNVDPNAHQDIRVSIANVDTKIDSEINKVNASIKKVDDKTLVNTNNIKKINQTQTTIQTDIVGLKDKNLVQDNKIGNIETKLKSTDVKVDTNTENIKNLTTQVDTNYKELTNSITNNSLQIKYNKDDIKTLDNKFKNYTETKNLHKVALSGDYGDLNNKPVIPSTKDLATYEYVDQKVDDAIGKISGFDFIVVQELPPVGESGHLYLVPHFHSDHDIYDEYIWVQSQQAFEKIGNTDVNLSNYYNKQEVNDRLKAGLDLKVDKVEGSQLISTELLNNMTTELDRLSTVYNYDDTLIKKDIATKQNKLIPGENITIVGDTISAKDTVYTAGEGISIKNNIITNTSKSLDWGNITGDINKQKDLQELINTKIDKKQDILKAGDGITIKDSTISGTVVTFREIL